ncbi:MAG: hypothetical protein IKN64_10090, partial [Desulfovibrio sp.]|nr:hypothetical protein [Desulfovibrio sp.]
LFRLPCQELFFIPRNFFRSKIFLRNSSQFSPAPSSHLARDGDMLFFHPTVKHFFTFLAKKFSHFLLMPLAPPFRSEQRLSGNCFSRSQT